LADLPRPPRETAVKNGATPITRSVYAEESGASQASPQTFQKRPRPGGGRSTVRHLQDRRRGLVRSWLKAWGHHVRGACRMNAQSENVRPIASSTHNRPSRERKETAAWITAATRKMEPRISSPRGAEVIIRNLGPPERTFNWAERYWSGCRPNGASRLQAEDPVTLRAGPQSKRLRIVRLDPGAPARASGRTRTAGEARSKSRAAPTIRGRRSISKTPPGIGTTAETRSASRRLLMLAGEHAKGQCQVLTALTRNEHPGGDRKGDLTRYTPPTPKIGKLR